MPIRFNQNSQATEYRLDYTGPTGVCTGQTGYAPNDFSLSFWAYVDTIGGVSNDQRFWSESASGASDCMVVWHYRNDVYFNLIGTTGTKLMGVTGLIPYRGWVHVVITITATGGAWNTTTGIKCYINGVERAITKFTDGSGNMKTKASWHLGNCKAGTLANQRMSGCLHRVHAYNRVLSGTEAADCFNRSEPSDWTWLVIGDSSLNAELAGGATDTAVPLASTPTTYTAAFSQTGWAAYRKNTGITGTTTMTGWTESQGHVTNPATAATNFPFIDTTFAKHGTAPMTVASRPAGILTVLGEGSSVIANSCTLVAALANPSGRPFSGQSTYNVMQVNSSATSGPTLKIIDGKLAVSDGTDIVQSSLFVPATPTIVAVSIDPTGVDFYVEDKTERVTYASAGVTWGTATVAYGSAIEYYFHDGGGLDRFRGDMFAVGIRNKPSTAAEVAAFMAGISSDHGMSLGYSALIVFSGDSQSARFYQNPNKGLAKQLWTTLYPRCRMFVAAVAGNTIADSNTNAATRELAIRTQWTKPGKDILVGWYGHNENWFTGTGAGGAAETNDANSSFSNLETLMTTLAGFTHRVVLTTIPRAEKATASENERFHRCRLLYNAAVMASDDSAGQTKNVDIAALADFLVTQGSGATSAEVRVITGGANYVKSTDAVWSSGDGDDHVHLNETGSAVVAGALDDTLVPLSRSGRSNLIPLLVAVGVLR